MPDSARPATAAGTVWEIHAGARGSTRPATAPQHRRIGDNDRHPGCLLRLAIGGDIDTERLRAAAERVVRDHAVLRRRLQQSPDGPRVFTAAHLASAASADPPHGTPLVRLLVDHDGCLLLELRPAPGVLDGPGLLRAAEAITTAYTTPAVARRPDDSPTAEDVDAFLGALLIDPEAATARDFWRRGHQSAPAGDVARALNLRHAPRTGRVRVPVRLDETTRRGLSDLARGADVAIEAVVLTAWRLLLARIAPAETGSLGLFTAGPVGQLPHTIGLLGRHVPIAAVPSPTGDLLADHLHGAEQETRAADRHGEFFAHPRPEEGFTVGFRHLTAPAVFPLGPGGRAVIEVVDAPLDPMALDVHSLIRGTELDVHVAADITALDKDGAGRVADWLGQILHRMAQPNAALQPAADVCDLPTASSRLTGPARPAPAHTLLDAFDAQTTRGPDVVAAADDRTHTTYRTLQQTSTALARVLRDHGIGPGDRVAVCMARRIPLLVALLAVWRCGAHYVPLDPFWPPARVDDLLRDATPRLLLTDADTADRTTSAGVRVLRADDPHTPTAPAERWASRARTSDTAYLIYTSGSTGRPKGVPVTHGALAQYLTWASDRYDTARGTGSVAHSSIAADLTVTSLFLPLLTGRRVTLVPSEDPGDLARVLDDARDLSPLKVTPGGMRLLTRLLTREQLARAVRHLVVGGEQLTARALAALDVPGLAVTNEYGPTEATVGCTAYTFRCGTTVPDPVPIGRPVWNATIELRTPGSGEPVLPGCAGEIVVLGSQVAAGYRNRPQESAARFFTDPAGTMAYRTGDLARLRPDGHLEMLGRIDGQLKIHGYRVEPGEIEAVLAADPRIAEAAVVATEARGDETAPVLSAFLVPAATDTAGIVERARVLSERQLPFYARPDRIHVLAALPRQPGGKVDRRALAALPAATHGATGGPRSHDDPVTATLARLWADILGDPPEGPEANFFSGGGDSLKAVLFANRAQRAGLRLTVHDVLHQRTLGRLATVASAATITGGGVVADGPIPLSPLQAAVLSTRPVPGSWTLRYLSQAPHPEVDTTRLQTALETVLRQHPALRSAFSHTEGSWSARLRSPTPTTVHLVDLRGRPPGEHEAIVRQELEDRERRFDLAGPLVDLVLIRSHRQPRIAWIAHHLVADLVSMRILTHDLWHAYQHPTAHQPVGDDGYLPWLASAAVTNTPTLPTGTWLAEAPRTVSSRLGPQARDILTATGPGTPRRPLAVVAGALLAALADVRPDLPSALCVELHGRDLVGHDLASTVGWLTTLRLLHAERALPADAATVAAAVHAQLAHPAPAPAGPLPLVALNYLGELSSGAMDMPPIGASGPLFPLEVVCFAPPGSFEIRWRACPTWMPDATLTRLAEAFARHAATAPPPPAATAVTPDDLARITATFGNEGP
ncbi:amino acid adenylation domain-containing protein (plasmid) [Embleya sp. NBC_00888]|uniref:amino acid adenylation domain-containing protein n=1 Tax=Embleya sp. NBC_00888 TaxID=2975960 RepID=UPI002F9076D9|nr:amino acid adenylation domain-containing protein [Embleya sp. NBC_00888]